MPGITRVLPTPLTEPQRLLIQVVHDRFELDGKWPNIQYVESQLLHECNLALLAVGRTMPPNMVVHLSPYPQQNEDVALTVRGFRQAAGSLPRLAKVLNLVSWFVERYETFRPQTADTVEPVQAIAQEAEEDFGWEINDCMRTYSVAAVALWGWTSGIGTRDGRLSTFSEYLVA